MPTGGNPFPVGAKINTWTSVPILLTQERLCLVQTETLELGCRYHFTSIQDQGPPGPSCDMSLDQECLHFLGCLEGCSSE